MPNVSSACQTLSTGMRFSVLSEWRMLRSWGMRSGRRILNSSFQPKGYFFNQTQDLKNDRTKRKRWRRNPIQVCCDTTQIFRKEAAPTNKRRKQQKKRRGNESSFKQNEIKKENRQTEGRETSEEVEGEASNAGVICCYAFQIELWWRMLENTGYVVPPDGSKAAKYTGIGGLDSSEDPNASRMEERGKDDWINGSQPELYRRTHDVWRFWLKTEGTIMNFEVEQESHNSSLVPCG